MSDKLRIGFAGGVMGRSHMKGFAALDDVEMAAVAEPQEELRQELLDTFGFQYSFPDLESMIADGGIDAVVIATPTYLHEQHASLAFDAGLHVLSEKPPAVNAREMSHIVTTAGLVGKTYMWARQQRFSPQLQEARRLVEAGEIGDVYFAEGRWQWGWWPLPQVDWRGSKEKHGGCLIDIGIHLLDSLWFVMGCPDPEEALGTIYNPFLRELVEDPEDAAEDTAAGMIRFRNGASVQFSAMNFSHVAGPETSWKAPHRRALQVFGTKAFLDLETGEKSVVAIKEKAMVESYAEPLPYPQLFERQAREFTDAIKEERAPQNDAKQGLTLMKMLDAVRESAREKRAVPIKTERSLEDLMGGL